MVYCFLFFFTSCYYCCFPYSMVCLSFPSRIDLLLCIYVQLPLCLTAEYAEKHLGHANNARWSFKLLFNYWRVLRFIYFSFFFLLLRFLYLSCCRCWSLFLFWYCCFGIRLCRVRQQERESHLLSFLIFFLFSVALKNTENQHHLVVFNFLVYVCVLWRCGAQLKSFHQRRAASLYLRRRNHSC